MKFKLTAFILSWIFHLGLLMQNMPSTDSPQVINFFQRLQKQFFGGTVSKEVLKKLRNIGKVQATLSSETPFPCSLVDTKSKERPDSVHKLRPGDIDIVAGIGDSYISGHQMVSSRASPSALGNRGFSWAAGGYGDWREILTLPNILKVFNPKLIGYSYGDSFSNEWDSQFNVAESGAQAKDMEYMAKILVKRMHADKRIDFEKDWKLITLMVGGNDVCSDLCYLPKEAMEKSPEAYRKNLIRALDYLRDYLPRTFISIVSAPNVERAIKMNHLPEICNYTLRMECSCMFGSSRAHRRPHVIRIQRDWYRVEEEVSNDDRYKNKTDFTVVHQPFTEQGDIPRYENGTTNTEYLTVECLHLSQKGNAGMANSMWNSLLEPVGKKSKSWTNLWEKFLCPSQQHPYLYTWANSNNGAKGRKQRRG